MIALDAARAFVMGALPRLPETVVPVVEAVGLVAAAPVVASSAVPPFDNSAVDGFAVRRADVDGAPDGGLGLVLEVVGESAAGHGCEVVVASMQAVQINTGAPVPDGADAVVMVEDT
ncbi:MAG: molybdopterin molybdenumtransferase MoeA, partial [Actinomycetes bacterium]